MAQAKVSVEAMVRMAQTLRQGAEDILSSKADMDTQLRSFVWDDPIGQSFASRYEEDFKPLTNKLIPAIDDYLAYIAGLEGDVADYNGVSAALGAAGLVGFATAASRTKASQQNTASVVKSPAFAGYSEEEKEKLKKERIVSVDDDPANVSLSEEDYERLKKDPAYRKRYNAYLRELRKRKPDLRKKITTADIDEINSSVFRLKEDELTVGFDRLGSADSLGGESTGEHASINRDFLDSNPDSSRCGVGAIGAHESSHAAQWKEYSRIFDKAQTDPTSLTQREKSILKSYPKVFTGWSKAYDNSPEEIDARISQYAFRDACNAYAIETFYKATKQ